MADNTNSVLNVWLEGQITEDGLNLALLSEKSGQGARVEAVEHISPEDLESRNGELFTLSLGDGTVENLSQMRQDANIGRILQSDTLSEKGEHLPENPSSEELLAYMGFVSDGDGLDAEPRHPQPGEIVYDENAPSWSDDNRVKVTEVLSEVTCSEYVIQGRNEGEALDPSLQSWTDKTVADANLSYSPDEPVILGEYVSGNDKVYAFPASRLQASP